MNIALKEHQSGYVAILGRPNAGKSTLLNRILKQKLFIISPKPQTTRHKILGIWNDQTRQAIFVDTPGWLETTRDKLQQSLSRAAKTCAQEEADVLLWIAEGRPIESDRPILEDLARLQKPMVFALNKIDLPEVKEILEQAEFEWRECCPWNSFFKISARNGQGVDPLAQKLLNLLPFSPPYFPKDQASDRYERFFTAEIIREKIFEQFSEEIPHACAVEITDFVEEPGQPDKISATIVVERESQKPIIIGRQGRAIRHLREAASKDIAAFIGRSIELSLWVKVKKNWRQDRNALRDLGYF